MNDPWAGILAEDEEILWQGRPCGRLRLDLAALPASLFGLAFALSALLWIRMAMRMGAGPVPVSFALFGLPFLAVGLWMAVGPHLVSMLRRRHSFYTLTNRRGFIATELPLLGRSLTSHAIDPGAITTTQRGGLTDVGFATTTITAPRRGRMGTGISRRHGGYRGTAPVRFEALRDPDPLLRALRSATKEAP